MRTKAQDLDKCARLRYGLTRERQLELYKHPCEICGRHAKKMCIDHVVPGTYRGVLCQGCNIALGWLERRREIIRLYLKRPPVKESLTLREIRIPRKPNCHTDRKHLAKGLCASCYQMQYIRERAAAAKF